MVPLSSLPRGGIVLGVGADLTEVQRIRDATTRQGDRFLARVYTADELAYCLAKADPYPSLAARFAAKEAVAKAFTTGIGAELGWHSISVVHGEREQPIVRLDAAGESLLQQCGGTEILLTLSHTGQTALAVALIVRAPAPSHGN